MIGVDTNILVYAHRSDNPWNDRAYALIQDLWAGESPWLVPWPCLHEFYCVVTHPKVHKPPTSVEAAINQVDIWLSSPSLLITAEGEDYWSALRPQLLNSQVTGPLVYDARIAAICLQAGVSTLWTADRDFSRFPDLRCENPLVRRK